MSPRCAASCLAVVFIALLLPVGLQAGTRFQAAQNYAVGGYDPGAVAVADLNGDGKPDLAVAVAVGGSNGQGLIAILLGNGDGTFVLSSDLDSGGGFATSVATSDLNGDGKLDLVVANCGSTLKQFSCPNDESDGVVAVFLGNGDGTFQTPTTYDSAGGQAVSIALADVNLDGKVDVLVGNGCADSSCTSAGGVGVLLGNGDGTLKAAVAYSGVGQGSVAVADVNGDGKPDLVLGGFQVGVMLGNGDGTFQFSAFYTVGSSSAAVVVADINRDGKPDVIAAETCGNANCTYGVVSVLLGNGDATFQPAVTYRSGGQVSYRATVADLDGDGNADVVVASCAYRGASCGTSPGLVSILPDRANGTLKRPVGYASGGMGANFVTVGDLNADGKPDLIVTDFFSNDIGVLLNLGSGTSDFDFSLDFLE